MSYCFTAEENASSMSITHIMKLKIINQSECSLDLTANWT